MQVEAEFKRQTGSATANLPPKRGKPLDHFNCSNQSLRGAIGFFVIYTNYANYQKGLDSISCYCKSRKYRLFLIPVSSKKRREFKKCTHLKNLFFWKHCVATIFLAKVSWLLVLDADTIVFNADRCIEEFMDQKVGIY